MKRCSSRHCEEHRDEAISWQSIPKYAIKRCVLNDKSVPINQCFPEQKDMTWPIFFKMA